VAIRRFKQSKVYPMMRTTVIQNLIDLESIGKEWNDLLLKCKNNPLYFSYEWFLCSYKVFHRFDKLCVITIRAASGELIGIAPMVIVTDTYRLLKIKKICFPNNNQNPSNGFICDADNEEKCIALILAWLTKFSDWNMVDLQMIEKERSMTQKTMDYIITKKILYGISINRESPYISMDMPWDDFWKKKSTKFKKNIRNKLNKIGSKGYTIEKKRITDDDMASLDEMSRISGQSWKRNIGADLVTHKANFQFYKEISKVYKNTDSISIYFLNISNTPAAFEFHLEDQQVAYPIRADYDENFKSYSPGSILEYEIISLLFKAGTVKEYNTCGHTYAYLNNWTDRTREFINIEIFENSIMMKLLFALEYGLLPRFRKSNLYGPWHRIKRLLSIKNLRK
jgi:hypothetical protein